MGPKKQTKKELLALLELHCTYAFPIVRHNGGYAIFYPASSGVEMILRPCSHGCDRGKCTHKPEFISYNNFHLLGSEPMPKLAREASVIRTATKWIIISVTIAILIWDVIAYCFGKDATVSEVLLSWAQSYPIIPFAAGVLSGHLWWPQKISDD